MLVVISEDQDKQPVTTDFCHAYAKEHNMDPAMLLMDYDANGKAVPLIDPPGDSKTFKGMATTWTHINPYAKRKGGGVKTTYPWNALLKGSNMTYMWSEYLGLSTFKLVRDQLLEAP